MEKTIIIDGKNIKFKTTGATPLRYKAQFGKDYFKEILKLAPLEGLKKDQAVTTADLEGIDFEVFYNISWVMAKQADNSIPEPVEWLDQFDEYPMAEIIPELQDMLLASFTSTKKK